MIFYITNLNFCLNLQVFKNGDFMKQKGVKIAALALAGVLVCTTYPVSSATGVATLFPAAGFALAIGDGVPIGEVIARADAVESAEPTEIKVNTQLELASQTVAQEDISQTTLTEIKEEPLEEETEASVDAPVIDTAIKTDNDETSKELETEPVDEAVEQEEVQIVVPEPIVVAKAIEQETEETTNPKTDVDDTTVIQNEPVTETVEIATVAKDVKMATTATSKTVSVNEVNTQEETVSANEVITEESVSANEVEQDFSNLVIAQVNDYVNVREQATEQSEIIGKLYNKSVGTLIIEENGWYKIHSGNVEGYVKAEYCVTGEEAEALVDEVGEKIATVTTTTLKVRKEPGTEAEVLGLVPIEEELTVLEETDGWVKVSIEEGEGYVSSEYVSLRVDFVEAESKEEEEARLKKEEEERQAARVAANARLAEQAVASVATETAPVITSATGSAAGKAVVDYALQFVGNPYVYGGTSLTNGADCSGFVMSVYAHFGVALPHSSAADRHVGYDVGGLENAQPGDLVCYSGHVGIYAGNGQIVHASSSRTGIIVSRAGYRPVLAVRRIF